MEICRTLAGYSYGRADLVRRAMAKKKHDVMQKERHSFVYGDKNPDGTVNCVGAVANGVSEKDANEIFDEMSGFASYAFNKSHAAAYAYLSYQTAYLKCHYTKEYMAALMSSVLGNTDKLIEYVDECRKHNINVLKPDINKSFAYFTSEENGIRYGLLAIKTLGAGVIDAVLSEREENGSFVNLQDFCSRCSETGISKVSVEYLIKAGAFDGLGANRRQMINNYEFLIDSAADFSRANLEGQMGLFSGDNSSPAAVMEFKSEPEYRFADLLCFEKFATGMYISGHPTDPYKAALKLMRIPEAGTVQNGLKEGIYSKNQIVSLFGAMDDVTVRYTSAGKKMGFLTLQDTGGSVECTLFPETYAKSERKLIYGNVLYVTGKISSKSSYGSSVIAENIFDENEFDDILKSKKFCIKCLSSQREIIKSADEIIKNYPGENQVIFYLTDLKKYLKPKNSAGVKICSKVLNELCKILNINSMGLID